MRLVWEGSALAELQALPPGPRSNLREALGILHGHDGDRPPGLNIKRLQGGLAPFFRLKVGVWRVVYTRQGNAHRILKVFHRSDGYGWLERLG